MTSAITLGGIQLGGFEIPEALVLGGRQRLAVHDLPGGGRVIDRLGPVEDGIAFSGVFSGAEAQNRARALDGLRLAGVPVTLAWNGNCRLVIVAAAAFEHAKPWWIFYRVQCLPCGSPPVLLADDALDAVADLAAATTAIGGVAALGIATTALGAGDAFTLGSAGQTAAIAALSVASGAVEAQLSAAGAVLDGTDIGMAQRGSAALVFDAATAAQTAAALAWGGGYLGRSLGTLQGFGA